MKYKQGDILTYNNSYRKILGVCGEVYFMSYRSGGVGDGILDEFSGGYTQYYLDRYGYKLYTPSEEVEPKLSCKPFSPKEAEYYRDWLIARKRIMDSLDSDSSWENPEQKKWTIYYDYINRHLKVIDRYYDEHGSLPPYKSKEEAEQAMQDLEDEYLVYFGIKRELDE